ncbi:MAG: hypothetical protein K9J12_15860 [Melioribacteraceae bacterium]|nr:hypothetical protein [Melioribacteraceae bacterium]MCF8263681.1 hypothetical protein [Melioribacteraceae bacterium]MCF8414380.1 hypothetical protein [Melioribacteraceae bacterium]MCF8431072.1 hypothetical protein [Melioribacteraceae bacterium]
MVALFVALLFITFLVIDYFIVRSKKVKHPAFERSLSLADSTLPLFDAKQLNLPKGVLLSEGHIWSKEVGNETLQLGLDEFILKALGKVKLNWSVGEGDSVQKGDVLFSANILGKELKFYSPIEGTVSSTNLKPVVNNSEEVYEKGWLVQIAPENLLESKASFFDSFNAKEWLQDEFSRFKEFLAVQTAQPQLAGVTMYDGGEIVQGVVSYLDENQIKKFEDEFLKVS